jgi:uncharacterized protein (TIGR03435 family)
MRTLSCTCAVLGVVAAGLALEAQDAAAPGAPAVFEAASVKEHTTPGDGSFVGRRPGGRFAAQNATLREIIEYAYEIQRHQLIGSLAPIEGARWDVTATLGAAAGQGGPDVTLPAVRALLADRFGLATHRETRTLPVYALRPARADGTPGPNLAKSALDCRTLMAAARSGVGPPPPEARQCGFRGRVGSLQATGMPLTELALALSGRVGRAVLEQTGLSGPWDLTLTYAPDSAQIPAGTLAPDAPRPAGNPDAPSLTAALQEQLGLRLVSTNAPVDVLVVDRVSRPTPD